MTVLYFSWVKEKVGLSEESVTPPSTVNTVAELMNWLKQRSSAHAAAFSDTRPIKAAIDQVHASPTASIIGANEVAFFPPVTGG